MAVYKEQEEKIASLPDRIKAQLTRKLAKTKAYLAEIDNRKKEIAEEEPPIPEDDSIPPFEQEQYSSPANGRLGFLASMKQYKDRNQDIYAGVLMDNDWDSMNAVKPGDEQIALGFLKEAFKEATDENR